MAIAYPRPLLLRACASVTMRLARTQSATTLASGAVQVIELVSR
jgi:hypothetical protein